MRLPSFGTSYKHILWSWPVATALAIGFQHPGQVPYLQDGAYRFTQDLVYARVATYGRKKAFVAFVTRLKASGKTPKEIVVALMRKIITIAQAVLKSQTPFNPELHAN